MFVRRAVASIGLALLSAALLAHIAARGVELGQDRTLSHSFARIAFASATAVARLAHGARGYVVPTALWVALQAGGFRSDALERVIDPDGGLRSAATMPAPPSCDDAPLHCLPDWGDDKGYADYVMLAYLLFGYRVAALFWLFVLLLGLSVVAFAAQYWRTPYLALVPLVLLAHALVLEVLDDGIITRVVHDARYLPALVYLAALHAAVLALRPDMIRRWSWPVLAFQMLLIVLVLDARASAIWLVLVPIAALAMRLLVTRDGWARSVAVGCVVLAGPLLLDGYRQIAYDARYTDGGTTSHPVWHNLYMGLAFHPDGAARDVVYTDGVAYRDAWLFLLARPDVQERLGIDPAATAFVEHDPALWMHRVGWERYEAVCRAMVLAVVLEQPLYVIESLLIHKPRYLAETALWQLGYLQEQPRWVRVEDAHRPTKRTILPMLAPWALAAFGAVLILTLLPRLSSRDAGGMTLVSLLLAAGSLAPSIAVGPVYYELQVVYVALLAAGYAGGLAGAAGIVALVLHLRSPARCPGASSECCSPA